MLNDLGGIAADAGLSLSDIQRVTGADKETVTAWLNAEKEPSWPQALKLLGHLAIKHKALELPPEQIEADEELQKQLQQAASMADAIHLQTDEGDHSFGLKWALSDKLHALLNKMKN